MERNGDISDGKRVLTMGMIRLFQQTDTTFQTNGDKVLQPLKCLVRKEDNGSFYADIELDLSYVNDLTEGRIVVIPTPQGDQAFRVSNVKASKHRITTRALHLFYDSQNYLIEDSYVVDKDANDALDHLNNATEPVSPFTTISDVDAVGSYRCIRKSLYEAVVEVQERWGGHIVRDNWSIGLRSQIGADNGVNITYGKNIKDISVQYNWNDVVTKLLPVGYDGVTLPEVYLESTIQYDLPYTKTVDFQQDLDPEEYPDEAAYQAALIDDLRNQAQLYLEANCVPKVTYKLQADISKLTDIGDTIFVDDERLGISLITHVIAYTYDANLGKYSKVEFGNFEQTIKGLYQTFERTAAVIAEEAIVPTRVKLEGDLEQATAAIWNTLGNSYVIYDGDRILVVDTLPKEDATNVIMINSAGIGFSNTGINGTFNSAWLIDGTMDMQNINVINLTADLIKGGTLKLGSMLNESGVLELYDADNNLIGLMDNNGLKMYGLDGSYVLMNADVGFAGYDSNDTKVFWADEDEFHMKKSVVEEEITLCERARFIPITIMSGTTVVNDGIGLIAVSQS